MKDLLSRTLSHDVLDDLDQSEINQAEKERDHQGETDDDSRAGQKFLSGRPLHFLEFRTGFP
jgi:hypothetical protein